MYSIKKISLILLAILFLVPAAKATGIVSVQQHLNFTPATTETVYLWATNNAYEPINFSIKKTGDLEKYVTLNQENVYVQPRAIKKFEVNFTFPYYLAPGDYKTDISVNKCGSSTFCVGTALPIIVHVTNNSQLFEPKLKPSVSKNKESFFVKICQLINKLKLSLAWKQNLISIISSESENAINSIKLSNENDRVKVIILEMGLLRTDFQKLTDELKLANKPVIIIMQRDSSANELIYLDYIADKVVGPANMNISSSNLFESTEYWNGSQAEEMGLLDYVGTLKDAKEIAKNITNSSDSKFIFLL